MAFRWDPAKARANRLKHGVGFPDAVGAFEDPLALTSEDPYPSEDASSPSGSTSLADWCSSVGLGGVTTFA